MQTVAQPTNGDAQITGIVHDTVGGIVAGATAVARRRRAHSSRR
jgi:hypothetical protein